MNKQIIITAIIAVLVGSGAGFLLGKSRASPQGADVVATQDQGQGNRGMRGGNRGMRGGMISGTIIARDDTSITVKGDDGSSHIVFVGDKTEVTMMSSSTLKDAVVGKGVRVFGQPSDAGAVDATRLELRDANTMPKNSAVNNTANN